MIFCFAIIIFFRLTDEEASPRINGLPYSHPYLKVNGNSFNGTLNGNGIHSTDESEENDK